ncbi:hypothetical protein BK142_28675 [Paenibacillus glucanolyticus]|nr:hypothetical protein BK142_28675 [Paenibacillus glucanolyticus]
MVREHILLAMMALIFWKSLRHSTMFQILNVIQLFFKINTAFAYIKRNSPIGTPFFAFPNLRRENLMKE